MHQQEIPGHDFPLCASCKWVRRMGSLGGVGWTCRAFPDGIPPTIVDGTDSHAEPYDGDHGIQFEEGESEELER
jgi:hypothetical protein